MDTIDKIVCFMALCFIAGMIIHLGTQCAQTVWDRTKTEMDELDLIEAATVPNAGTFETILIFVAIMLRSTYKVPMDLVKEARKQGWEKSSAIRMVDRDIALRGDILGAIAIMLSGYPERARSLFEVESQYRVAVLLEAERKDYQSLLMDGEPVST